MVAILTPDAVPAVRFTVDEYLTADLPEGFDYELVNGVIVMSPKPGGEHDDVLELLGEAFSAYRRVHPGRIAKVSGGATVVIPGSDTAREPDLAVYTEWERGRRDFGVWRDYTPVLVIEVVSPDQERRDYHEKRKDYWKAGVREYWIVDPSGEAVTVLVRGAKAWRQRTVRPGRSLESHCFAGLTLNVADLFAS
jgi:Uma2 family endonuclease